MFWFYSLCSGDNFRKLHLPPHPPALCCCEVGLPLLLSIKPPLPFTGTFQQCHISRGLFHLPVHLNVIRGARQAGTRDEQEEADILFGCNILRGQRERWKHRPCVSNKVRVIVCRVSEFSTISSWKTHISNLSYFSVWTEHVCSMQTEWALRRTWETSRWFPSAVIEQTYFSGCSSMWAQALFVQDDTLHIHSSTSRQTSTDLGSLPVCVWETRVWREWWNVVSCGSCVCVSAGWHTPKCNTQSATTAMRQTNAIRGWIKWGNRQNDQKTRI